MTDKTKPHLRKFFKVVPMLDEDGRAIPNNPPIQHGGPWEKPKPDHRIRLGTLHETEGSKE